jgi:hypothetical protein
MASSRGDGEIGADEDQKENKILQRETRRRKRRERDKREGKREEVFEFADSELFPPVFVFSRGFFSRGFFFLRISKNERPPKL